MIQITDLSVKKNDGTTVVTYVAKTPASGELPATWKLDAASAVPAFRPSLSLSARSNGARTAQRVVMKHTYPVVQTIDGVAAVRDSVPVEISAVIPNGVDESVVAEAISQAFNIANTNLVKDAFKAGAAPV